MAAGAQEVGSYLLDTEFEKLKDWRETIRSYLQGLRRPCEELRPHANDDRPNQGKRSSY